ncbi:unnamed protein product, partial [Durusdinium trenchii]
VTQDMNLGQWLNSEYSDRDKFERVISRIVHSRGFSPEEMDSDDLLPLIRTLLFFKAQYQHKKTQMEYHFEALRLGQETAEKQQPSALDFVGQLGLALEEHVKSTGKKVPLFQGINHVVTEFNKTVTVKKWRIDPAKKRIITNLMHCPEEAQLSTHAWYWQWLLESKVAPIFDSRGEFFQSCAHGS